MIKYWYVIILGGLLLSGCSSHLFSLSDNDPTSKSFVCCRSFEYINWQVINGEEKKLYINEKSNIGYFSGEKSLYKAYKLADGIEDITFSIESKITSNNVFSPNVMIFDDKLSLFKSVNFFDFENNGKDESYSIKNIRLSRKIPYMIIFTPQSHEGTKIIFDTPSGQELVNLYTKGSLSFDDVSITKRITEMVDVELIPLNIKKNVIPSPSPVVAAAPLVVPLKKVPSTPLKENINIIDDSQTYKAYQEIAKKAEYPSKFQTVDNNKNSWSNNSTDELPVKLIEQETSTKSERMLVETERIYNQLITQSLNKGDFAKALKLLLEANRVGSPTAETVFLEQVKKKFEGKNNSNSLF
ncbi:MULTISPECIES: MalM family protein [unclassified Photobacterium]|uniref:MalM family protein n=1 Tax=unclassified Photobacterium TaxID=2628852 RepID=UPI000D15F69B|nr:MULTISPECIES: MalM family protein [unclassified Photobacterium]PSV33213.1 hypothetical protein C9J40_01765 [Photobacterium sp. GB-72]PSV40827.1 hypothetical protein C9J38_01970 [Photobacterium sp. GB-210]PSV55176.1 hypothetical protein C9J45_01100 [Photobacterium sp. GB-1]PSW75272.1 hypothetical protein C9J41_01085 [Photobacterium sp. GB-50]